MQIFKIAYSFVSCSWRTVAYFVNIANGYSFNVVNIRRIIEKCLGKTVTNKNAIREIQSRLNSGSAC
jgi:hypothetical protein